MRLKDLFLIFGTVPSTASVCINKLWKIVCASLRHQKLNFQTKKNLFKNNQKKKKKKNCKIF
jgi:hypothetical protein